MQHTDVLEFDTLAMLASFCGVNNTHIAHLESLFSVSLFVSGLRVDMVAERSDALQDCKKICEYLMTCIRRSMTITNELIDAAVHQIVGVENDGAEVIDASENHHEKGTNMKIDDAYAKEKTDIKSPVAMIEFPSTQKRVVARTRGQAKVLHALENYDLAFFVGPAGTGKTFLATAYALSLLLQKKKERYVITRPVVEAGEHLGFLPGDLVQKILPYMRPIYDALHEVGGITMVDYLQEHNRLELAPLAYMRGRTLHNSVVLLDEAQNCTMEQMKMFLTRAGENTKVIVTGDIAQSDLPQKKNGLEHALEVFAQVKEACIVRLSEKDVVRSVLAKIIVEAYNRNIQ